MRPLRASLLLALSSLPIAAQSPVSAPRQISLDDAVRMAQAGAPATVASRNALRTNGALVRSALAQFFPNVGASLNAARSGGETFFQGQLIPYTGDPWSYGKGFSASMTLFDGGQRWLSYRAAQWGLDAAEASDVSQRYTVAQAVKIQYFAVLAARESEAAGQRQLEQADKQMQLALARIQAGAAVRLDSIRSAILVVNARLAILNARNALRNANASLTRLVASPVRVTAMVADTVETAQIDMDSTELERLADHGPAVRAAQAAAASSHSSRLAATTAYLPALSVGYSYRNSSTSKAFTCCGGPASSSNSLYFSLSYTVFDGLHRELGLTNALVAESNADAALRDAKLAARESLEQLLSGYRTAQETIQLQVLNIAAAEEDLNAQQQRYAVGGAALLDVLNAQTVLETARAALVSARFQARTAKAQIETLIGRDLQ